MAFCTGCGANIPDDLKFCTSCGKSAEQNQVASPPKPQAAAPPPNVTPQKNANHAVMSVGAYIGTMLLFCIPLLGWLICLIMAFAAKNLNRRNFARAMLVFLIIGIVISVICYFVFTWIWSNVIDYFNEVVSEATGGLTTELGGFSDLMDLINGSDINE